MDICYLAFNTIIRKSLKRCTSIAENMMKTARHWPRSIDWKRHERQKECPQGVVIGSNSNFRQSVQSKSSLRSAFPGFLLTILAIILSKFWRESWRRLLHINKIVSKRKRNGIYCPKQAQEKLIIWPFYSHWVLQELYIRYLHHFLRIKKNESWVGDLKKLPKRIHLKAWKNNVPSQLKFFQLPIQVFNTSWMLTWWKQIRTHTQHEF